MAEHYSVRRIACGRRPDETLAVEMMRWGRIMGSLKMVPYVAGKGWAGNIGFRDQGSVWVTPTGCVIGEIHSDDIVGLVERDGEIVFWGAEGKRPTSEWEIYWGIFKRRPEVNAILHGHDMLVLEAAESLACGYREAALTKSVTESGSAEFRDEILEILTGANSYLIGREHGFFALGNTFEQAGLLALEFRNRATELMVGKERYQNLLSKYHLG